MDPATLDMQKKLLQKQQELLELQQKKIELELLHSQFKLQEELLKNKNITDLPEHKVCLNLYNIQGGGEVKIIVSKPLILCCKMKKL